jgi:hypothetical protein
VALRLGWRSVEEMEQGLSFREYQEWVMILNSLSNPQTQSQPRPNGSGPAWQDQLKTMRALGVMQQLGGNKNGRN